MWYRPPLNPRHFRSSTHVIALFLRGSRATPAVQLKQSQCRGLSHRVTSSGEGELKRVERSGKPHLFKQAPLSTSSSEHAQVLTGHRTNTHDVGRSDRISLVRGRSQFDSTVVSLVERGLVLEAAQFASSSLSRGIRLNPDNLRNLLSKVLHHGVQCMYAEDPGTTALRLLYCTRDMTPKPYLTAIDQLANDGDLLGAVTLFEAVASQWLTFRHEYQLSRVSRSEAVQIYPKPAFRMLIPILQLIVNHIELRDQITPDKWSLTREALLRLLNSFNSEDLPIRRLSLLVKTCQSFRQRISNLRQDKHVTNLDEDADHRVHSWLTGLILLLDLPQKRKQIRFDLNTCNSLLNYAFRFCHSQHLTLIVLRYMFELRVPALDFHPSTRNILLRSSSLLRRNGLAKLVMEVWGSNGSKENMAEFLKAIRSHWPKADIGQFVTPTIIPPDSLAPAEYDARTYRTSLVAYINHWTAVGRVKDVVKFVYCLFPALVGRRHNPSREGAESRSLRMQQYIESVHHAARLGPFVISAVLNSVVKAGKIGLVERFWQLANQAEIASWDPSFCGQCTPWRLSIHSYTSVIQAYARERRRGIPITSLCYSMRRPVGWALDLEGLSCSQAAQVKGFRAYLSFGSQESKLLHTLEGTKLVKIPSELPDPIPDNRFFDAALRLFSPRRPSIVRFRPKLLSNRRSRGYFKLSMAHFLRWGYLRQRPNAFLRKVLLDMKDRGLELPRHHHHLLVPASHPLVIDR